MDFLLSELSQTLGLRLVDQAYLNEEGDRVVVELKVRSDSGLMRENILFFSVAEFKTEQVKKAIIRLQKEPSPEGYEG